MSMNAAVRQALMNQLEDPDHGYIYEDGSYSDQREPRGATVVPRRKREGDVWDHGARCWLRDGEPVDPDEVPQGALISLEGVGTPARPTNGLTADHVLESMSEEAQMELLTKLLAKSQPPSDEDKNPPAGGPEKVINPQPPATSTVTDQTQTGTAGVKLNLKL